MGCGVSRFDENGAAIPVKARPLFLLRLEEFKRRRHPQALKDSTPSKKVLLLHDREDDEIVSTTNDQPLFNKGGNKDSPLQDESFSCVTSEGSKGGSSAGESDDDSKKDAKSKEETLIEKNDHCEDDHEGRIIEPMAKNEAKNNENIMDGDIKKDKVDDDDDDEGRDEDDGRKLRHHEDDDDDEAFPGSPSFRVYFVDNVKDNKNEGLHDHVTDMAPIHDDSVPSELRMAKEEEKKGKKRRSFKKVLPTGRQAKNLFNVRACMSSTHSTHDGTRLLTAKAHA